MRSSHCSRFRFSVTRTVEHLRPCLRTVRISHPGNCQFADSNLCALGETKKKKKKILLFFPDFISHKLSFSGSEIILIAKLCLFLSVA